ncbi:hypothetical protein KC360_g9237 [Hortaea werneckii]|nr:hypothetical protein KC325_g9251 [Hortaea werneckii]KAI6984808.1 hypothetical protein KC359_g9264 [Hortaea werneckii]KAI7081011.1 hypothetical protein KC356_g9356 [Hortaea werneckii]KAI7139543.1 hypothetical protein KC344_g9233 [Hortaea werneckii]KAI7166126.1 hypothetical protein KC360_g9237 [Hortaea werneckii]
MDPQKQMQALSEQYQGLQTELTTLVSARQKLESQQQENKNVQKEFQTLNEEANIYKLVGPVLLKQDSTEAKSTVEGRLEYIDKEIKRIEGSIKDMQEKTEGKKMEMIQIQTQAQQATASG